MTELYSVTVWGRDNAVIATIDEHPEYGGWTWRCLEHSVTGPEEPYNTLPEAMHFLRHHFITSRHP